MKRWLAILALVGLVGLAGVGFCLAQGQGGEAEKSGEVLVVVQGDDMGFSRACNLACIKAYQEGVLTTVEVLAPGPWFLDAAALLRANPGLDVGVHLDLTSEWDNYKWGPVTSAKSLVDEFGHFPATTAALEKMEIDLAEVEAELRAQIALARKYIPQVSHLTAHMGTAISRPELEAIVRKLAAEFALPLVWHGDGMADLDMWAVRDTEKESYMLEKIAALRPGVSRFTCHPGLDNEEMRGIAGSGHDANVRLAAYRQAVTDALVSAKVKALIKEKGVKLVSNATVLKARKE